MKIFSLDSLDSIGPHAYPKPILHCLDYCSFVVSFEMAGASLVVQCLSLCTPSVGGPSSILARGARFHMLHLKIPQAASEDLAQPNK